MAENQTKAELLDEETLDLSTKFQKVLKKVFERFDIDKNGVLSREELLHFFKTCNDQDTDFDDFYQNLTACFECNNDGALTEKGFLDMYHLQTSGDEEETWKDIHKWGYNDQLELEK
eukprot:TRINITY_DN2914_c0_g1_i2.p2 TRINITY_DN2914_c0_g1~~TRINITY_DN2914_c0_g1_i2.p2  ORF type:complete len:117 (-),score=27.96 TRINITY_DN2914_c0_g1_i2:61-411(-)